MKKSFRWKYHLVSNYLNEYCSNKVLKYISKNIAHIGLNYMNKDILEEKKNS